eukprot:360521-Chlamydomonas_euryale.AAC.1
MRWPQRPLHRTAPSTAPGRQKDRGRGQMVRGEQDERQEGSAAERAGRRRKEEEREWAHAEWGAWGAWGAWGGCGAWGMKPELGNLATRRIHRQCSRR